MLCCLHIPDFVAAAVLRCEPELRGQPLAVLEGTPPLQRVCAVNETARLAGMETGMTRLQAEALPGLTLRRRSPAQEEAAHAALLDCAHAFSPRVEAPAPGTVLADLAGLERLFGAPPKIARALARRAFECGLEANVAVAQNREAAVHAARGFSGITVVAPGDEARRLGPLPIDVLFAGPDASGNAPRRHPDTKEVRIHNSKIKNRVPRGYRESAGPDEVNREASKPGTSSDLARAQHFLETLDRWGVHNLRGLAALPTVAVAERLGQEGVRLQKLARGEGSVSLVPTEPPLRFEEALELEHPVDLLEPLSFLLARLLEQLCARLGARALATNELRLALTLDGTDLPPCGSELPIPRNARNDNSSESARSSEPSMHRSTAAPIPRSADVPCGSVLRLPVPMLDAKVFLKLLQLELKQRPPGAPVVKIALAAEPVRPQVAQHGLFQAATPAPEKLQLMLARLAGIVGEGNAGSPELLDTHRPGAFRMQSFAAETSTHLPPRHRAAKLTIADCGLPIENPGGVPPMHGNPPSVLDPQSSSASPRLRGEVSRMAMRIFRPPLAATVEMKNGKPVRLSCLDHHGGALAGEITWAAGPWRASGDWWGEAARPAFRAGGARRAGPWHMAHSKESPEAGSFSREEWDVTVASAQGTVLCRLVHDLERSRWFAEGTYD